LKRRAEKSDGRLASRQVNDMVQMASRFEKKSAILSSAKPMQMAPQIRLVQNNDRILLDKIQTSIQKKGEARKSAEQELVKIESELKTSWLS
jgi:uncharacterized protein YaaN involved in tellurite resistance